MSRTPNTYKRFVLSITFACLLSCICFFFYLETSIDDVMTQGNYEKMMNDINNSPVLPERFLQTFEKYNPDAFSYGVWRATFNNVIKGKRIPCQCKDIYWYPYSDNRAQPITLRRFSHLVIALEVEEHYSPKKCFEYNMATTPFGHNVVGAKAAAKRFYGKNIEELNEREILELTIMQLGPTAYSPIFNGERLDKAVDNIIKKNR